MTKIREFYKGGFWHIYNRGVAKEGIFHEKGDYIFYLYKLKETLKKYSVTIHAYNFLPNHLHYLIEQTSEITPSKFFSGLHTSFSSYINRKYNRVGHLFQNRFQEKHIEKTDYLLDLSLYIHLNKILEKLQHIDQAFISKDMLQKLLDEAERDPWNSYSVYLGLREDQITQDKFILSLISDNLKKAREDYQKLAKEAVISGKFLKVRDLIFEDFQGLS